MKFFFSFLAAAVFPAIFANEFYSSDVLKDITDRGINNITEVSKILDQVPKYYGHVVIERFECLLWQCSVELGNLNKTTANSVVNGLVKNKKLPNFQCVSDKRREAADKLDAKCSGLPQELEKFTQNALNTVLPYRFLIPGFNKYVQDLYQTKSEELGKTKEEAARKKIISEVENKIKILVAVLDQIKDYIQDSKHKFFESFVDFVYATENLLKKIQREGSQKIAACVN